MFSIKDDKTITLTRGDTLIVTLTLTDSADQPYTPQSGDVIRFALKKWYTDEDVLITKTIPNNTMILRLDPADTASLKFGDYVYDLQITYADGRVDTFIAKATFKISEEVA